MVIFDSLLLQCQVSQYSEYCSTATPKRPGTAGSTKVTWDLCSGPQGFNIRFLFGKIRYCLWNGLPGQLFVDSP